MSGQPMRRDSRTLFGLCRCSWLRLLARSITRGLFLSAEAGVGLGLLGGLGSGRAVDCSEALRKRDEVARSKLKQGGNPGRDPADMHNIRRGKSFSMSHDGGPGCVSDNATNTSQTQREAGNPRMTKAQSNTDATADGPSFVSSSWMALYGVLRRPKTGTGAARFPPFHHRQSA